MLVTYIKWKNEFSKQKIDFESFFIIHTEIIYKISQIKKLMKKVTILMK